MVPAVVSPSLLYLSLHIFLVPQGRLKNNQPLFILIRDINTHVCESSMAAGAFGEATGRCLETFSVDKKRISKPVPKHAWSYMARLAQRSGSVGQLTVTLVSCCSSLHPKHVAFSLLKLTSANSTCLGSQTPQHRCNSSSGNWQWFQEQGNDTRPQQTRGISEPRRGDPMTEQTPCPTVEEEPWGGFTEATSISLPTAHWAEKSWLLSSSWN